MKKTMKFAALTLLVLAMATFTFAHEDHEHTLMGTVKMLHENHLTISLKDGGDKLVTLTETTQILKGEEKVDRTALEVGVRVSVEVDNDDKALAIKVAAEAHHQH